MRAVFIRAIEAKNKATALRDGAADYNNAVRFEVETETFSAIPRSPFAYWASDRVRRLFSTMQLFESKERFANAGTSTGDDQRFVRLWWEPKPVEERWRLYTKGGSRATFYADVFALVDWLQDGLPIELSFAGGRVRKPFFGRTGITWPLRGIRFSAQAVPPGCVFSVAGKMAFAPEWQLPALLAVFNSRIWDSLIGLYAGKVGGVQYEVGIIQSLPLAPDVVRHQRLAALTCLAWALKRRLDTRSETSHAFVLPALLQVPVDTLWSRAEAWRARVTAAEAELTEIQDEIDELCFVAYGIDGEDRERIELGFGAAGDVSDEAQADDDADDDSEPDEGDVAPLVTSLLSWCVGVSTGRFDARLAIGDGKRPAEPEPFDPLPPCSPGMLTGDDGLLVDAPPHGYPIDFPRDGVLVDDQGHDHDLVARTREVFQVVFGDDADDRWREAAEILDPRGRNLRAWFAGSFFEDHIKRYSKSRRKAPIYWQLATPSASYSVWLYYHRFTRDTLYRVLHDYVAPKLKHEERKLTSLTQDAGPNPSASQPKEIDTQERFVAELRAFRDEVARVAPLWNPDLNDGVIINFAPLWRLVPQHRSWQKECKKVWDKLVAGDYDWAHLAMHLWPERVVPKCAKDRSLAIAHGLEDVFWEEDDGGKWHEKTVSKEVVQQLIEERTSPAVKAALEDLLSAPAPTKSSRARRSGGRRRRAARAAASTPRPRGNGTPARASLDARTIEAVKQAIAAASDGASKSDVMGATGISASEWNAAIRELLAQGVVTKTGAARGTRYHLQGGD